MGDFEARRQASEMLILPEQYTLDRFLDEMHDKDPFGDLTTGQILDEIKPLQYSKFALLIEKIFDRINIIDLDPSTTNILPPEHREPTTWQLISHNTINAVANEVKFLERTDLYKEADKITGYVSALDPGRHRWLDHQLISGATTGSTAMLTLIYNSPGIIDYLDTANIISMPMEIDITRRSSNLAMRLARLSIEQSLGAQHALTASLDKGQWGNVDKILDPEEFMLTKIDDEYVLAYRYFSQLTLPKGHRVRPESKPLEEETKVLDIESGRSVQIGCPITLVAEQMERLWRKYVTIVVNNGEWKNPYKFD